MGVQVPPRTPTLGSHPGSTNEVAASEIGDSAVLELVGLGGAATAASPAVAASLGGSVRDAASPQAPIVEDTDDLNQFQIGARSIDPSRMTDLQWLTNRQMAMVSVDALDRHGLANVAHYPLIDITNAVLSRMLVGGTAPAGEQPVMQTPTQGAIFYEVRSVGQKSNGQLENLFRIQTMAVLAAAADGSLSSYDISGYTSLPYASQGPCGQ